MKQLLFVLTFFMMASSTQAQQPEWKVLLNSNQLRSIAQNTDVIWMGTYGGGVVRCDKSTGITTNFNRVNSSLRGMFIEAIAFDHAGNVWFSSQNGLTMFDGTSWQTITTSNSSLPSNVINDIAFDSKKRQLILATEGGLVLFDPITHNCQTYKTSNSGLKNNNVHKAAIDSVGTIWLSTSNENYQTIGALWKFDGTTWTNFIGSNTDTTAMGQSDILNIEIDARGNAWAAGNGSRVFRSNGSKWLQITVPNTSFGIDGLSASPDSTMWLGTEHNLFQVDDTGAVLQVFTYSPKDSLGFPNGGAATISVDADTSVWCGAYAGLTHIVGKKIKTIPTSNCGLGGNIITTMKTLANGSDFINSASSTGTQIQLLQGASWQTIKVQLNGPPRQIYVGVDNSVWSSLGNSIGILEGDSLRPVPSQITADDDNGNIMAFAAPTKNNIWQARQRSLAHFDGNEWKKIDYNITGFGLFNGLDMKVDRNGMLWYGMTYNGLVSFDGTTWKKYTASDGFTAETVNEIEFDSMGMTWVATEKGLFSYDGTTWKLFTAANSGIPFANIGAMVIESPTSIWIASGEFGVCSIAHFDGSKWEVFNTTNSPLGQGGISSLNLDNAGNLWIGNKQEGIAIYKKGGLVLDVKQSSRLGLPSLELYPNPANETCRIELPSNNTLPIFIYNSIGELMQKIEPRSAISIQVDLKNYPAGMYHVQCGKYSGRVLKVD